jgi:hypothetical protein
MPDNAPAPVRQLEVESLGQRQVYGFEGQRAFRPTFRVGAKNGRFRMNTSELNDGMSIVCTITAVC